MNVKEFFSKKLSLLAEAFPHITIKYEYNDLVKAHIVELSPLIEYYNNSNLDNAWAALTKTFWNRFPAEGICFISTDSTLRIENPELAFNQESYYILSQKIEYFHNLQTMIVKEFIREKLAQIAEAFPQVTIKYNFNDLIGTHIVELSPEQEYYNNTQLDDAWLNLVPIFWDKFPAEDITFISTDSTLRIENPEFAFNQESNLLVAAPD